MSAQHDEIAERGFAKLMDAAMTKDEFCQRFKAEMLRRAGDKFDDGTSIAEYADEVGPLYWSETYQREEGPETCADTDMSYWGE